MKMLKVIIKKYRKILTLLKLKKNVLLFSTTFPQDANFQFFYRYESL